MNTIRAKITKINGIDNINLISFIVEEEEFMMMSLELNPALQVGSEVILGIKATTVSLAKEKNTMLSISNQFPVQITRVDNGALLSSVKFSFSGIGMESIITKSSAIRMELKPEDEVVALVKASDLSIVEIL